MRVSITMCVATIKKNISLKDDNYVNFMPTIIMSILGRCCCMLGNIYIIFTVHEKGKSENIQC